MLVMGVLSLAFICIPFIPGINILPRKIPIYKLIWKEHYRSLEAPPTPGTGTPPSAAGEPASRAGGLLAHAARTPQRLRLVPGQSCGSSSVRL